MVIAQSKIRSCLYRFGPQVSCCEADILGSSGVILPGVGAFGRLWKASDPFNWIKQYIVLWVPAKAHGNCLGMHLLASSSNEFGEHHGLGVIPGRVVRLANNAVSKVPNVGGFNQNSRSKARGKKNKSHFTTRILMNFSRQTETVFALLLLMVDAK